MSRSGLVAGSQSPKTFKRQVMFTVALLKSRFACSWHRSDKWRRENKIRRKQHADLLAAARKQKEEETHRRFNSQESRESMEKGRTKERQKRKILTYKRKERRKRPYKRDKTRTTCSDLATGARSQNKIHKQKARLDHRQSRAAFFAFSYVSLPQFSRDNVVSASARAAELS